MSNPTVATSLASVFVGWLLSQLTVYGKDYRLKRALRAGLLTELVDIRAELDRIALTYERAIQLSAAKGIEPAVPGPASNFFFTHHYKDVFISLNREQRLSYQIIHKKVDAINAGIALLLAKLEIAQSEQEAHGQASLNILASWDNVLVGQYHNVREATWHIERHLESPTRPVLDLLGPMHVSYMKFVGEVDDRIATLKRQGAGMTPSDFEATAARPAPTISG